MTTPHKDADKLIAIAQGKQMQVYGDNGTPWVDASQDRALVAICAGEPCRVKPQTIMVNGVECPKPMPKGTAYPYVVTVTMRDELRYEGVITLRVGFEASQDAIQVFDALTKPFKECRE